MEQMTLPVAETAECDSCECVSGDGLPPSVEECSCSCHDTARLFSGLRPWSAEL